MTTPVSGPAAAASAVPLVDGAVASGGGLPRGLVILLGAAATVVVIAGIQAIAWLIGPDALLRASAKEPDPAAPKPGGRRPSSVSPAAAPTTAPT